MAAINNSKLMPIHCLQRPNFCLKNLPTQNSQDIYIPYITSVNNNHKKPTSCVRTQFSLWFIYYSLQS